MNPSVAVQKETDIHRKRRMNKAKSGISIHFTPSLRNRAAKT